MTFSWVLAPFRVRPLAVKQGFRMKFSEKSIARRPPDFNIFRLKKILIFLKKGVDKLRNLLYDSQAI